MLLASFGSEYKSSFVSVSAFVFAAAADAALAAVGKPGLRSDDAEAADGDDDGSFLIEAAAAEEEEEEVFDADRAEVVVLEADKPVVREVAEAADEPIGVRVAGPVDFKRDEVGSARGVAVTLVSFFLGRNTFAVTTFCSCFSLGAAAAAPRLRTGEGTG